jgi:putative endonuclease
MVAKGQNLDSRHRRVVAERGENLAVDFLRTRGFRIVERNWSCREGEIDIVCERDGVLHFVEVKTRTSAQFGSPAEAITKTKLRRFATAIQRFLAQRTDLMVPFQADAFSIFLLKNDRPIIEYIEHVFE